MYKFFPQSTLKVFSYMLGIKCGWVTFMANHPYFFFHLFLYAIWHIRFFVALFVLSLCPFDISVGVGAFVIGLG